MRRKIYVLLGLIVIICILSSVAAQSSSPPRFREVMSIELRQIQSVVWHPGGGIIVAAGEQDVWLFDANMLTDVAHLDLWPYSLTPYWMGDGCSSYFIQ